MIAAPLARGLRRAARMACAMALVCLAAGLAPAQETRDESRQIFHAIGEVLGELTKISGMKMRHPVPYDLISRDKVKEFLQKRVKEVTSPEELRAEELTLKKFGLVPADFDLKKNTVDLLTEQAAAFYDYNKKRLYITDWTPSDTREAALVHELAHALADQNYHLDKYIKQGQKSDDGATARMAVMEGQATWLMSEYLARQMGQSLATSPTLLEMMSRSMDPAGGQFPIFENSPLYLRETLIFPYTKGMLFQQAVYVKDGKAAFGEVFHRPPESTQQILHVDKYFSGVKPTEPALPVPPQRKGFKDLIEGSIGELDHRILLEQYLGKEMSREVAPHWRGGRYRLLERKSPERVILSYVSEWDEAAAARKYFQLYRRLLAKKWKKMTVARETEDAVAGEGDDGYFLLRLEGTVVSSLEGLESPAPAVR
ncbi:MAG TPA: hypothetical protein VFA33_19270 [Bryobacteraceae bacterium]|nr:hypothetical protein [Bryobacteraceae bacterium]